MNLIERTSSFLGENLPSFSDSSHLLAVSGGPDSMCLLTVMNELRKKYSNLSIYVAHLNHSLHEMSQETEKFVRDWCNHLNVPYMGAELLNPDHVKQNNEGLEATARNLRYEFLTDVAQLLDADCFMTAHHFDDQVETVLLNLGRGSGPYGLQGMKSKSSEFEPELLRPFIKTRKHEILTFLEERDIPFMNDPTNRELKQARNRLRRTILPEWKRAQPDPANSIHRLSNQVERENEFWEEYLKNNVRDWHWENEIQVDIHDYRDKHSAVQFRYLHSIPMNFTGGSFGWSEANFEDLHELFTNSQSGKQIHLPGKFIALREYDRGIVTGEPLELDYDFEVDDLPFKQSIEGVGLLKVTKPPQTGNDKSLLSTKLEPSHLDNSTIRTWCPGEDKLNQTSKSLKEIFDENRIPYRARRRIPLITKGNHVLAIPGLYTTVDEKEDAHHMLQFFSDHPSFHNLPQENRSP